MHLKMTIKMTNVRLAKHRDQLLHHIQTWHHEDKKAYKITFYRFFLFMKNTS